MKVYVYQEKKKVAVALVQMYEYSAGNAAQYVGAEKEQVLKWLYERIGSMPRSPLASQTRVQKEGLSYPTPKSAKHYSNIVELKEL